MHCIELKQEERNGNGENIMEKTERQSEGEKLKKREESEDRARGRGSEVQTQKPLSLFNATF